MSKWHQQVSKWHQRAKPSPLPPPAYVWRIEVREGEDLRLVTVEYWDDEDRYRERAAHHEEKGRYVEVRISEYPQTPKHLLQLLRGWTVVG